MIHISEYVSKGHPDRLADAIVESIVQLASERDSAAFCGLECAVFDNTVFVDGRVAASEGESAVTSADVLRLVKGAYAMAGYAEQWQPVPQQLEVIQRLRLEPLPSFERSMRCVADDQNIVTGYACLSPVTNYLPPAHYVALRLGNAMTEWRSIHSDVFGPDFKLLLQMQYGALPADDYKVTALSVSIQHSQSANYNIQRQMVFDFVKSYLLILESEGIKGIGEFGMQNLSVNGYGLFCEGGPMADNGLSGKKLVIDFYGPEVPIGGGAICGKDAHKIDVCGAFYARRIAVDSVIKYGCRSAFVQLGWQPGDEAPAAGKVIMCDKLGFQRHTDLDSEALDSAAIALIHSQLPDIPRQTLVTQGYFLGHHRVST